MGDFILAKGWTGTMWWLHQMSHLCMYSKHNFKCLIHQSGLHTISMSIPLRHAQSCSCPVPIPCRMHTFFCAAGPTLQVPFSFLHSHSQGAAIAVDGSFIDWMSCLCPQWLRMKLVDWFKKSFSYRIRWSLNGLWRSSFQSLSSLQRTKRTFTAQTSSMRSIRFWQ